MSRRRHEPPEERQLKKAVANLRIKLCITAADGYFLTSERSKGQFAFFSTWHRRQPVNLRRSFVEAAAKLSMLEDFDVHQFDAFCICLRCSTREDESAEISAETPAYSALCNWLLEISRTLITPAILSQRESEGNVELRFVRNRDLAINGRNRDLAINQHCNMTFNQRFSYFQRHICRAQVWSDMGGSLFQRLKMVAKVSMYERV
jgi:hypothetical protein